MQGKSRLEHYKDLMDFVLNDIQKERRQLNKRMLSAVLWCFIIPAAVAATLLLLVRIGVLPWKAKAYSDWAALLFPVLYSMYVFGSEVLVELPMVFRKGGVSATLSHAVKESEWRERVCEGLKRSSEASLEDWRWIIANFRIELSRLRYRIRFLTGLAGAVFYLLLQGIDLLVDPGAEGAVIGHPASGLVLVPADWSQYLGLILFLGVFYLSGSQSYHSLKRYLDCAELVAADLSGKEVTLSEEL